MKAIIVVNFVTCRSRFQHLRLICSWQVMFHIMSKGGGGCLSRTSFFSSPKLSLPPLHSTQVGFFLSLFALFRSSFFCLLFFFFLGSPKSSPLPSPPFYLPSSLKSSAHVLLNSLQCFLCLEIWKVLLYLEFLRIHHSSCIMNFYLKSFNYYFDK